MQPLHVVFSPASSEADNYDHGNGHSRITDWPILLPEHPSTVPPSGDDFEIARNTEESNRMLYIILGCVLGILVIFLLFCMAMCAWKQQQRAHMFGRYRWTLKLIQAIKLYHSDLFYVYVIYRQTMVCLLKNLSQ